MLISTSKPPSCSGRTVFGALVSGISLSGHTIFSKSSITSVFIIRSLTAITGQQHKHVSSQSQVAPVVDVKEGDALTSMSHGLRLLSIMTS
jgi:hypothetical protein